MAAFFRGIEKALKGIVDVCALISGFMIIAMTFTTVYGVVMRYFFRAPEPVSYELATIFLLWGFLFAISFVEWKGEHIRADIFTPFMPGGLVTALNRIVAPVLALIYCSVLTWKGWVVAMYSFSIGERSMSVWQEPLGPVKVMIPLGYGLLTLVVLRMLVRGINAYSSKEAV
jgi:TRAP-type C4-dicarboxylate transport system permease small subunit